MESQNTKRRRAELEELMARAEKKNRAFLSGLSPYQTALFAGTDHAKIWTAKKRSEQRESIRMAIDLLSRFNYDTFLVDDSTLFGCYALEELARQKEKYKYTLVLIKPVLYHDWLHVKKEKLRRLRARRSREMMLQVDYFIDELSPEEWRRFQYEKVNYIVMQGPSYYCNPALRAALQSLWDEPQLDDILPDPLEEDDDAL